MERIKGLDTLRFICAFVVVLGHLGAPELTDFYGVKYVQGVLNNSFVGIAGVMIFFIISGFCIHYPYSNGRPLNLQTFYTQRLLRIGIPAIIAVTFYWLVFDVLLGGVWSLICEIIYYLLYPIILNVQRRISINKIIGIAFVFSIFISGITDYYSVEYNGDFHRNGFLVTWIIGLPVWLLGVKLANDFAAAKTDDPSKWKIYCLRILVWGAALICSVGRFHLSIPYAYSLLLFSLLGYYWVKNEISFFRNKEENSFLELGGQISYSIYLVHMAVPYLLNMYFGNLKADANWFVFIFVVFCCLFASAGYYYMIERPSHKFAKTFKFTLAQN